LEPGEFNFNLLYSLYGPANGGGDDPSTSAASSTNSNTNNKDKNEEDKEEDEDEDDRRLAEEEEEDDTPDYVKEKYAAVRACLEAMSCSECLDQAFFDYAGEGTMIHNDSQGEACEFDLGEGYTMQTHKLLVR
jgi:hypothetical protein